MIWRIIKKELNAMWKKTEPVRSHSQLSPSQAAPPATAPRNPAPPAGERAMIGPTISIKGDLTGEEELLIEGRLEGKIELRRHSVTVGKNGKIKGDIFGKIITIAGSVEGNLFGEEQLIVRQSGTVRGNIVAPRVALEDGSNFKGNIDMSSKDKQPSLALQSSSLTENKTP
jgi:cytoskeletal protein CcmA (bactofilin family)